MLFDQFRDLNIYTILIRVILALVIGGSIGLERGLKKHPAGFKTYMLVCLGATLVMMTNQYIYNYFSETGDIARLGAQVISGIGFLGAGTIIVTRQNQVRGLTTAAGLWTAACVGLAIGIGFYEGAVFVGIAVFLIMTFFNKVDKIVYAKTPILKLYLNLDSTYGVTSLIAYCKEKDYNVSDIQIYKEKEFAASPVALVTTIKLPRGVEHEQVIEQIAKIEGVNYLREI